MKPLAILLVDDDSEIRTLLKVVLETRGYEVTTAENGRQGSRLIVQRAFDLVLTDLLMPERDGLEFIGDVRKQQPGARIIAMSGGGQIAREPYLKMAKAFGAHALLEKPFSQEQLWAALASVQDSAPPTVGSTPHAPHPR